MTALVNDLDDAFLKASYGLVEVASDIFAAPRGVAGLHGLVTTLLVESPDLCRSRTWLIANKIEAPRVPGRLDAAAWPYNAHNNAHSGGIDNPSVRDSPAEAGYMHAEFGNDGAKLPAAPEEFVDRAGSQAAGVGLLTD